jgi:biopolymer transport protein ExbB
MYLLLVCSIVVLAVILDRVWFWLGRLRGSTEQTISQANEAALIQEGDHIYSNAVRNLGALDTVISIAPLLGILGTVLGIMKAFHAIDLKHLSAPSEVGHGLAEAMLTTAAGLIVAVPAIVAYNIFHAMARCKAERYYKMAEQVASYEEQ